MKDKVKTVVVFRRWKGKDGDVIALFPGIDLGNGVCLSYEHVGQHSEADYKIVIARTRPAKPSEYQDLLQELGQIGYNVVVRKRRGRF